MTCKRHPGCDCDRCESAAIASIEAWTALLKKVRRETPNCTCMYDEYSWSVHQDIDCPDHGRVVHDTPSIMDRQVGGDHYTKWAIQPIDFIVKNDIPFREANAVKYIVRHRDKGGAEDIKKAIHYLQMILESEYGE